MDRLMKNHCLRRSYRPNWLYLEMKVMSEEKKSYMNLMEMLEGVSAKRFSSTNSVLSVIR